MTASQFRSALTRIGASQSDFARLLGVSVRQVSRWATGTPVPAYAAVVLRLIERAGLMVWEV